MCKDWIVQDTRKEDKLSEKTAKNMLKSNDSRPTWGCDPKDNRAKSG